MARRTTPSCVEFLEARTLMSVAPLPSVPDARLSIYARPVSGTSFSGVGTQPAIAPAAGVSYTPAQIRHAYGVDQLPSGLDGSNQTIAIIDAYDDPKIASDLATFDNMYGLPAANFTKVVPSTGTPAYDQGWAVEISLDVEWAHAIAPGATILLVEAASSSFTDLLTAVDTAVSMGAKQVSMSWGSNNEFSSETSLDSHFQHPGVTFLASSGDSGSVVEYPAVSPYVTAVGGTTLPLDANSNRISETAWNGSGGGVSTLESLPTYQTGFLSAKGRGVPDVSYDADPSTGYYVYDSLVGGLLVQVGGTSAAAPQWAGLIALANQGRASAGLPSLGTGVAAGTNPMLYQLAGGTSYTNPQGDYYDVTSGTNGGYSATVGYDPVTGLGSPIANKLIPALINGLNGGPQDLSASFNRPGIVADGSTFVGGLADGYAYSANLLGPTVTAGGNTFTLGATGGNNAISAAGQTVALTQGNFSALAFLGAGVDGNQAAQTFTVHYTDGSSQAFTQGLSDWYTPQAYAGESVAATTAYRDTASGGQQALAMNLYAYSFALNPAKVVSGITLPNDANVEILAIDLS
jgi:subtilase family serine protease